MDIKRMWIRAKGQKESAKTEEHFWLDDIHYVSTTTVSPTGRIHYLVEALPSGQMYHPSNRHAGQQTMLAMKQQNHGNPYVACYCEYRDINRHYDEGFEGAMYII